MMNISGIKLLLFVPLFLLISPVLHAQQDTVDYLRHRKFFDLCSYKRECTDCHACGKQRHVVKIKNNVNKRIKKVTYVFYSDVYNKLLYKEAKLKGDVMDASEIGLFYICIPEPKHWAISEIVYSDDTKINFVVKERLQRFEQEPDECECNDYK